MVKLRLRRRGRKARPIYDIVATDSRSARDGRSLERVGQYNPLLSDNPITMLDRDRVLYWLQYRRTADRYRSRAVSPRRDPAGGSHEA